MNKLDSTNKIVNILFFYLNLLHGKIYFTWDYVELLWKCNCGSGIVKDILWKWNYERRIVEVELWKMNYGSGIVKDELWKWNCERWIMEVKLWKMNCGSEIVKEELCRCQCWYTLYRDLWPWKELPSAYPGGRRDPYCADVGTPSWRCFWWRIGLL